MRQSRLQYAIRQNLPSAQPLGDFSRQPLRLSAYRHCRRTPAAAPRQSRLALIVKKLKKYYGVGSPCRTLLYCLRLAALYYFFTSPTIFLISGFLGGFTTYSSFILDFLKLAHSSQSYALLHLAAHLFGGIAACRLGMLIGKGLLT